jgi:hypothetical protein
MIDHNCDAFDDYLELRDPRVKIQIEASRKDFEAGRVREIRDFIAELSAEKTR